jgi:hypothetical protein
MGLLLFFFLSTRVIPVDRLDLRSETIQRHTQCQLRRLGARGGAGKPTLLSLKN